MIALVFNKKVWSMAFMVFVILIEQAQASIFTLLSTPSVTQDIVLLDVNSAQINQLSPDNPIHLFDDNILPAVNLTQPSHNGLRGILYNRGQACNLNTTDIIFNINYQKGIARIALIKGGGPCALFEKIRLAQQDGAAGAIVYEDGPATQLSSDYMNNGDMNIPSESGLMIPAFHVPPETGDKLFRFMAATTQSLSPQQLNRQAVRILMLPGSIHGTNPWELTLIIMIVVLGIGFVGSVGMHCHLVRKNARLRRQVAQGLIPPPPEMLPMGKQLLDPIYLEKLRTRKIGGENAAVDSEAHAIQRRESRMSSEPRQGFNPDDDNRVTLDDDENDCCVVCLEKMEPGDLVRQLPCEHEYHQECIDPWLTTKSGECPLCKFDCVAALAPPSPGQTAPPPPTLLRRIQGLFLGNTRRQQQHRQNDEETQRSRPAPPETIEMATQ